MDSGNNSSGSMQSSSGGEEEYDSRAESSLAALFNNQPPQTQSHVFPFTTNFPLIPPQQHHQQMFDSLSNFLDPTPSLPNPNLIWSKPTRSEPNQTDPTNMNQAFMSNQLPQVPQSLNCVEMNNIRNNNNRGTVRNPKKRSRASRRAPTTVLTTDTTNFRAMVQEFTGIPAPPFTPSSSLPFSRSRFDLFSSSSSSTTHFDPPYLLRPFPQKLPHLNSNTNHLKQPLTFSTHNNNNPFLTFQSPKYPPQPNSLEIPLNSAQNSSHIENLGLNNASTVWAQSNVTINGSSSGFNAEKGPECDGAVAARNQGTMESWINCSSD